MRFSTRFTAISALAVMTALSGCGGGSSTEEPQPVVVDGSSTVFPISLAAAEEYLKEKPDVQVIVHKHGTGGGFGKYAAGEADIVNASRPAKPDEEKKALEANLPWTRFLVGYDGITVVVNPKNDFVKSLTVEQLKRLFEPDSKVTTWKDLDPSWPERKIVLFSPDKDSGTFDFFTEEIVGKSKAQRKDVQPNSDDNVLVTGVSGDPDALAYFGYSYFAANSSKLRSIPIQASADSTPVSASPETILNKTYKPLARPLFIYVKNAAMNRPEAAGFVNYYLSTVEKHAQAGGYVPPTDTDKAENKKVLDGILTAPAQGASGG